MTFDPNQPRDANGEWTAGASEISITQPGKGTGKLIKAADGKWDIELNGQRGGPLHYTQDQVKSIVSKSQAAGHQITAR